MSVSILSFSESILAPTLAKALLVPHKKISHRRFADGEFALVLPLLQDIQHIVLVIDFLHAGSGDIHTELLALIILLKQLAVEGICEITVLMPYLPYARSCKLEATAVGLLLDQMQQFKKATMFVVDMHVECPQLAAVHSLSSDDVWLEQVSKLVELKDALVVSPDAGGAARAISLAERLHLPVVIMEKYRKECGEVYIKEPSESVVGKTILLRDDIVATGQTAALAAKLLKEKGAAQVFGLFTHAVISPGAEIRLQQAAFDGIFFTNSLIKSDFPFATMIDLTSLLSNALRLKINM